MLRPVCIKIVLKCWSVTVTSLTQQFSQQVDFGDQLKSALSLSPTKQAYPCFSQAGKQVNSWIIFATVTKVFLCNKSEWRISSYSFEWGTNPFMDNLPLCPQISFACVLKCTNQCSLVKPGQHAMYPGVQFTKLNKCKWDLRALMH